MSQTGYVALGMPLANLTGVKDASYFYDGTDPVSGRQLSTIERGIHGVLGSIQLAGTGFGAAKLMIPQPGPAIGSQAATSSATTVTSKKSTVTVYRVESPGNQRLAIDEITGGVEVLPNRNTLFLNFGDEGRALQFKQLRLAQGYEGTVIKEFEVMEDTLQQLRKNAVKEFDVRKSPGSPIVSDINKAPDQFGLRSAHIEDLIKDIIQGTGKVR